MRPAIGQCHVLRRPFEQAVVRDARTWRMLLVQSVLNSIGAWTVLAWGQQYVDSGLASVLNSTSPIFVFLITALVTRHEALGGRKLAGAVLGLMGVALIVGVDVRQQVLKTREGHMGATAHLLKQPVPVRLKKRAAIPAHLRGAAIAEAIEI